MGVLDFKQGSMTLYAEVRLKEFGNAKDISGWEFFECGGNVYKIYCSVDKTGFLSLSAAKGDG